MLIATSNSGVLRRPFESAIMRLVDVMLAFPAILIGLAVAAIFGGFTPAISTYLIHLTGNRAVPGIWLSFAAGCGLLAALLTRSGSEAVTHPARVSAV